MSLHFPSDLRHSVEYGVRGSTLKGHQLHHDRWAIPVAFYSIIVKRAAVIRSFPGNVEEFERIYDHPPKNGAMFSLPLMSLNDVEVILGRLNDAGVVPGEDAGVVDMMHGPLLECSGMTVQNVSIDEGRPQWTVNLTMSS